MQINKRSKIYSYFLILIIDNNLNSKNTIKLAITIVAPVGVAYINDIYNPTINDTIEIIILDIITLLNFLNNCIDESVGKIIKLDINKDPINLIPKTTTIEHKLANIILYKSVFTPIDLANLSSNVIANILLYENTYKRITIIDKIILTIISFSFIDRILPNK
jgi:hypothetical protein